MWQIKVSPQTSPRAMARNFPSSSMAPAFTQGFPTWRMSFRAAHSSFLARALSLLKIWWNSSQKASTASASSGVRGRKRASG